MTPRRIQTSQLYCGHGPHYMLLPLFRGGARVNDIAEVYKSEIKQFFFTRKQTLLTFYGIFKSIPVSNSCLKLKIFLTNGQQSMIEIVYLQDIQFIYDMHTFLFLTLSVLNQFIWVIRPHIEFLLLFIILITFYPSFHMDQMADEISARGVSSRVWRC